MQIHDTTPVLVGAAAVGQRFGEPGAGLDEMEIVVEAARRAIIDSGTRSLAGHVGWVGSTRGLTRAHDVSRFVADSVCPGAHTVSALLGVPQQTLLNMAFEEVLSGRTGAAIVCGGEAKWRTDLARRSGVELEPLNTPELLAEERIEASLKMMARPEVKIGAVDAVQQYAMIDNARRVANGWSIPEHLDDIAELWYGFNVVARSNPLAAFPEERDRAQIRDPGPGNRLLSFPYNKWHVSQWSVDQSAALVICSVGVASECGIPRDRWVFPHVGVESSHSISLSRRRRLHGWPAMKVLGDAARRRIGRDLADVDHIELYSCFPAAVRAQQAELGLPPDRVPTITGGMSFAGGPFNNFSYQATVAMIQRLRSDPGTFGAVTTVSGLLTKPGLAVWSTKPPDGPPMIAGMASEVNSTTDEMPLNEEANGTGTVVTYTSVAHRGEPVRVAAIVDLDSGARAVAAVNDASLAASVMAQEFIGTRVRVRGWDLLV